MNTTDQLGTLSIAEFADRFAISTSGARRLIASGELHAVKLGRRVVIPRTEAHRFQDSLLPKQRGAA